MTQPARGTPVRLGLIGLGIRGTEIAKALVADREARVVAVADLYAGRRERAAEIAGAQVVTTADFRQLLARRDVDAVVIATPDHWHVPIALDALQAGKDVYCESPVLHVGQDGKALEQAATNRIFQGGGALTSAPSFAAARDAVASGRLGKITVVRAVWDTGSALDAWQRPFPPDASPDSIDFAAFLGAAPRRPFSLHRFFRWPCYWDYGSGLAGARVVPLLTAIQSLLALNEPARAAFSGDTWRWKDGREVPDALVGTFDYADGVTVTIAATQNGGGGRELRLIGSDATLVVSDARLSLLPASDSEPYTIVGEAWAKGYRDWFYMMHGLTNQGAPRREFPPQGGEEHRDLAAGASSLAAHLRNFIDCVRTRQEPSEPLPLASSAAAAVARASAAMRQRATVVRQ